MLNSTAIANDIIVFTQAQQIVFIDSQLEDYQFLAQGVLSGIEKVIIDRDRDGIEQITEVLNRRDDFTAIHIVSHGSPGCLYLGNTQLSLDTLSKYEAELQTWFSASSNLPVSNSSNLLLYGCNVAAGDAGEEFVTKLHNLTGANIAASTTPVGSSEKLANWDLDFQFGNSNTELAFSQQTTAGYSHILEGTKQLSPTANDDITLYSSNTTNREFAQYNAPEENRLNININDPDNELVYLGFSEQNSRLANVGAPYYFRIVDPNGNVVGGPHLVDPNGNNTPSGGYVPNLSSHADAVAGPSAINAGGYNVNDPDGNAATSNPWVFDPSGLPAGDYSIEFDSDNDPNTSSNVYIDWFDITVANTSGGSPVAIDGRLWSQAPQFFTIGPTGGSFDEPLNGTVYGYTNDGLVTQINFDNSSFRGAAFTLSFNETGTADTGNIEEDRKSVTGRSTNPDYKIFFSQPDSNAFAQGTPGNFVDTQFKVSADLNSGIEVNVTQPGQVQLFLDFDNDNNFDPEDVLLNANVPAGKSIIPWDIKDGNGNDLTDGDFPIPIRAAYGQGITHFAAYDVEFLDNGFAVQDFFGNPAQQFWDDTNLEGLQAPDPSLATPPGTVVTPDSDSSNDVYANSLNGAATRQTWTNPDYGNERTLNTWWFAVREQETSAILVNNVPTLDLDGNVPGNNYQTTFVTGTPEAIADTDTTITDVDDTDIESATITLTNAQAGDILSGANLPTGTGISIDAANSNDTEIFLTGTGSLAEYQAAIAAITFNNPDVNADRRDRTIEVVVNDGLNDSNLATSTIAYPNTPPTIDLNGNDGAGENFTATFTEGNNAVAIVDTDGNIFDGELDPLQYLTITPKDLQDGANEILNIAGNSFPLNADKTVGGVTIPGTSTVVDIAYKDGAFRITEQANGELLAADLDLLIRGITYENTSDNPTATPSRSFDFQTAEFTPGTILIDFEEFTAGTRATSAQLESDVFWGSEGTNGGGGDSLNGFIRGATSGAGLDGDADGNYLFHNTAGNVPAGQQVVFGRSNIPIQPNVDYEISLDLGRSNNVAAGPFEIVVNGTVIGTVDNSGLPVNNFQTHTFTYNSGSDSTADFEIRNTSTNGTGNDFGIDNIKFETTTFVESNVATATVNLNAVNDAPVLDLDSDDSTVAGNNFEITFSEGGNPVNIADSDIAISDVDDTNINSATITLTNARTDDVLAAANLPTGITASAYDPATGVITLTGSATLADYQSAIQAISFNNTSDDPDTTDRLVNVVVNDGTADSNIATTIISINDVNDPPVAVGDLGNTDEDTAITLDILDNDSDIDGNLEPTSVVFVNPPADSTLSADSKTLTVPGEGEYLIDPDTGSITFTPVADYNGTPTPVEYQVADDDGDTATATINLTVNDILEVNDDSVTTTVDTPITFNPLINDDTSNNTIDPTSVVFVNPPMDSTLSEDGKTLNVLGQGTYVIDPENGEITFTPETGFSGTSTPVDYQVTDDAGFSDIGTIAISIESTIPLDLYKLSGNVLVDTDNDNAFSAIDTGIEGVTLELFAADIEGNPTGSVLDTAITDPDGFYEFTDLAEGDYVVEEIQPVGYDDVRETDGVTDNKIATTIAGDDSENNSFLEQARRFDISGAVFFDTDNSGDISDGDSGVENATLGLYALDRDGNIITSPIDTTSTNDTGFYEFTDLLNGDYVISRGLELDGDESNRIELTVDNSDSTGYDFLDEPVDGTASPNVLIGTSIGETISGYKGQDTLTGGGGSDKFVYTETSDGIDIIMDFTPGEDQIDLSQIMSEELAYDGSDPIGDGFVVLDSYDSVGTMIQIDFDNSGELFAKDVVFLDGVDAADINPDTELIF